MEAGLEHLKRGTARNVDVMLIIAEPSYRSLAAAMRTHELSEELAIPFIRVVANEFRNEQDRQAIEDFCRQHGITIIGNVPLDETLGEAERHERSPYEFVHDGAAVAAIRDIADAIDALAIGRTGAPSRAGPSPAA